jgi:hypothetical protein
MVQAYVAEGAAAPGRVHAVRATSASARRHLLARGVATVVEQLQRLHFCRYGDASRPADTGSGHRRVGPVDLVWNDDTRYAECFETLWPHLNPCGGVMVFYNTAGSREAWDAIGWMRARRREASDLEILTLPEPHKVTQNSCTILRRTSAYVPSPLDPGSPNRTVGAARRVLAGDSG